MTLIKEKIMKKANQEILLIIDFGSQVTKLIARRIRELNVYCEIYPNRMITKKVLKTIKPKAIILSGGPASVLEYDSPRIPIEVFGSNVPGLGICYGQQLMIKM